MLSAPFSTEAGQDFVSTPSAWEQAWSWLGQKVIDLFLWLWNYTVALSHWVAAIILVFCFGAYFIHRDKKTMVFAVKIIFAFIAIKVVDMVI